MSETVRAWDTVPRVGSRNWSERLGRRELIPLFLVEMAEKCNFQKSYSNTCHLCVQLIKLILKSSVCLVCHYASW